MDIKIINSINNEVYVPLQGLSILEDNGKIRVVSGAQIIGYYSIKGPVSDFKSILDKINQAFVEQQEVFDLTEYLSLYEEE